MKTFFLVGSAILIFSCAGAVFYLFTFHSMLPLPTMQKIQIGSTTVAAEVVDTEAARERGLSGRGSLAEGSGMLFVFQADDQAGIWMKDMKFSIDIIWLDASGTVITIAHDISPDTYPQAFYPARLARYVLELPAGYAAAHSIAEGSIFVLQ